MGWDDHICGCEGCFYIFAAASVLIFVNIASHFVLLNLLYVTLEASWQFK